MAVMYMMFTRTFRDASAPARIVVSVALLGGLVLSSAVPTIAAICGDANQDQKVKTGDALVILRNAVGIPNSCTHNCDCDLDCSRTITAADALYVLQAAVFRVRIGCCRIDGCSCLCDDTGYCYEDCVPDPEWPCDTMCVPKSDTLRPTY